ncbi:MAG: hypothetical protein KDA87_26270, partial [Planctomycetales bacterium]|nr:hypothetical protein [Planctomycetales bacterium]
MISVTTTAASRHDRRHPDELPEWMTKKQVSEYLQISQRQCEILTKKGRLPEPVYLGRSSPRWNRAAVLASLTHEPAK